MVSVEKIVVAGKVPADALAGFEGIKRYWDSASDCFTAKILPGEYYVTTNKELIVTVLGSCVSACIRDTKFGIGGMNHFMLPKEARDDDSWTEINISAAARYGNYAMEYLINNILKNGGSRQNLEVKVIGGGKILAHMTDIGERNIKFVRNYLNQEGFNVAAEDLGDIYPRKVVYNPITGKVKVRKLRSMHSKTIVERETNYMEEIVTKPVEGEIDLF